MLQPMRQIWKTVFIWTVCTLVFLFLFTIRYTAYTGIAFKTNIVNDFDNIILYTHNVVSKQNTSTYAGFDDLPICNQNLVNCSAIISGDESELEKAKIIQLNLKYKPKKLENDLLNLSMNCSNFLKTRKYLLKPVNKEEEEFPIAFSLLLYKEVFMAERLLRAIYRPQNFYCIHVDLKSSPIIHQIMQNIAECFDNVFIASTLLPVVWDGPIIAQAELICQKDLLNISKKWKYFVNVCGQELPIKTNLELVRVLNIFNGANDVEGLNDDGITMRLKYGYKMDANSMETTEYEKPKFPYNVRWIKGSTHVIVNRGFVEFLINSEFGRNFTEYIGDTRHADEHMWNPIQFSPHLGAPGAYTGPRPYLHQLFGDESAARYKMWEFNKRRHRPLKCHGKWEKLICIISVGDLQQVVNSNRLFVNKFHADYHPLAYDCLEQYVWNNTRLDIQGIDRLNITYYQNLPSVKHHI